MCIPSPLVHIHVTYRKTEWDGNKTSGGGRQTKNTKTTHLLRVLGSASAKAVSGHVGLSDESAQNVVKMITTVLKSRWWRQLKMLVMPEVSFSPTNKVPDGLPWCCLWQSCKHTVKTNIWHRFHCWKWKLWSYKQITSGSSLSGNDGLN